MPDEETSTPVTGDAPAEKTSVTPKRVITAARKEQNRLAQKAYRKRQKEHREKLRADAVRRNTASRPLPVLRPQDRRSTGPSPWSYPLPNQNMGNTQCRRRIDGELTVFGRNSNERALVPTSTPSPGTASSTSTGLTPRSTSASTSISLSRCEPSLSLPSFGPFSPEKSRSTSNSPHNEPWESDSSSSCGIQELGANSTAPHLLRAGLHLAPHKVFSGTLENALALGFEIEQLLACTGDYLSPFYQPNATPQSDPNELMKTCTELVKSSNGGNDIPVHLRPTMAQVLIPHHASIDLVPIPFFRERAIMLSVAMPERFNIWELKSDIYHGDGLMFWQPTWMERGSKPATAMFRPWDMRSWEAAPWFLQKWCMIFGGRDHAFWKQSMWWNALRRDEDAALAT